MSKHIKNNEVVLKGSDPIEIEALLKDMVSLNLHTMIKKVSCISSFDKNQNDKLAALIAPSKFTAPLKSIYVLSKTL